MFSATAVHLSGPAWQQAQGVSTFILEQVRRNTRSSSRLCSQRTVHLLLFVTCLHLDTDPVWIAQNCIPAVMYLYMFAPVPVQLGATIHQQLCHT